MEEIEAAWLAGILEGEGWFSLTSNGSSPRIQLNMCDRDVVDRASRLMGGNGRISELVRDGNRSNIFRFNVFGGYAIKVILRIYPYLGARRKGKVDELMAIYANRNLKAARYGCGGPLNTILGNDQDQSCCRGPMV